MPTKQVVPSEQEEMFLDESLYELHVEQIRQEGAKRERKGVMMAIKRFLDTPKGKVIGISLMSASLTANVQVGVEYYLSRSRDVYSVESEPSDESFAGDRPLEEVRSELTEWLGEDAVRDLVPVTSTDRDRSARERRREEMRREDVAEVNGFEAVGIPDELVEEYLEQGFPRFMTAGSNVESIEFTPEHRPMREDYHLGTGAEAAGSCSIGEAEEASEIELYGALLDSDGRLDINSTFNEVLSHELAHAIDWENLDAVDPATRTRMLHQMVSRVRDEESRLHFSYVERINSDDPQAQLRNRTTEYYAEFTSCVFQYVFSAPQSHPNWSGAVADSLIRDYGNPEGSDHELRINGSYCGFRIASSKNG